MTRNQLPIIPEPAPAPAPHGTVNVLHAYDGTCDSCGGIATEHGWIMRPNYLFPAPNAGIVVERTGWCGELSCIKDRARWATVLDREPAWEGHEQ